jgi:hypothetical protein
VTADERERWKKDPVLFAREFLGVELFPWQEKSLRALVHGGYIQGMSRGGGRRLLLGVWKRYREELGP